MKVIVLLEALGLMIGVGVAGAAVMTAWVLALARLEAATVRVRVPSAPRRR